MTEEFQGLTTPPVQGSSWRVIDNITKAEEKRKLWHKLASAALQHYNKTKGVEFEFSGTVNALHGFYFGPKRCYHINFEAKRKDDDDVTCLSNRFFAQVFKSINNGSKVTVKLCEILDPNSTDLVEGCDDCCPRSILHPKDFVNYVFPRSPPAETIDENNILDYCQVEEDGQFVEEDPVKVRKDRRKLLAKLGAAALLHYNNMEGRAVRKYKIVGDGSGYVGGADGFHLNIVVKSENGSPALMFAEVYQSKLDSEVSVKYVMELDTTSDLVRGCPVCRRKVLHPKGNLRFWKKT